TARASRSGSSGSVCCVGRRSASLALTCSHAPARGRLPDLSGWRVTLAVCPRFRAVAADLHVAPSARAVLRVIVERPLARVLAAGLQPLPRPLRDRIVNDREQPSEPAIDAFCLGLKRGERALTEAEPYVGAA